MQRRTDHIEELVVVFLQQQRLWKLAQEHLEQARDVVRVLIGKKLHVALCIRKLAGERERESSDDERTLV